MRRVMHWLLLVALSMLALQSALAGAVAHGTQQQPQQPAVAWHPGHHAAPQAEQGTATAHADCCASHASAAQIPAAFQLGEASPGPRALRPDQPLRSARMGPEIERPKWTHAG